MRLVRKAASVAIAAALTAGITACGTTPQPVITPTIAKTTTAVVPGGAQTTAGTAIKPTADNLLGIDWAGQAPFTGPAADKFGAVNVMAAYREAVTFSLQEGYSDLMTKGYDARPVEFSFVKPFLTPAAQTAWDGYVKAALAKDRKAGGSITSLTLWNSTAGQTTYKFRPNQELFTLGLEFSPATTSIKTVDAHEFLTLHFTVSRSLRVMKDGKAVLLPMKKDITYQMTPNGQKDMPWLIDSWNVTGTYMFDKATPDPLGTVS